MFSCLPCSLHIEIAMWKTFGDYLEARGWTTALTQASSGTADPFLKVSHLTRTRHAHQINVLTLCFSPVKGPYYYDENTKEACWRKARVQDRNSWLDLCLSPQRERLPFLCGISEGNSYLVLIALHQKYARYISVTCKVQSIRNLSVDPW